MALKLKALSGPLKGQEFPLKAGLRIGRSKGDILLDDGKVSSLHAFLTEEGGAFVLNDNGSKNGIRVGRERVGTVELKLGVVFQIGQSDFEVITEEPATRVSVAEPAQPVRPFTVATTPSVTRASPGTLVPAAPKPPAADDPGEAVGNLREGRKWNDILAEITTEAIGKISDQPKALVALTPAIRLTFIGGVQAETRWTLGYGPRRAGAASIDLPIFETGAPEICFEIIPAPEGVTFRTNHPKQVTLNGAETRVGSLKEGDLIAVGQTRIEVELIK